MRNQYTWAYYPTNDKRAGARQGYSLCKLNPAHPIQTKSLFFAIFQQKPQKDARPKPQRSLNCEAVENEMEATSNGQDD
jgi:hypothetical protein